MNEEVCLANKVGVGARYVNQTIRMIRHVIFTTYNVRIAQPVSILGLEYPSQSLSCVCVDS